MNTQDQVQKKTILILDDEPHMRNSMAAFLDAEGMQTITASEGREAISLLEKKKVDVIISDLKMPGMNGLEFLEWIKNSGPVIPVIMISAHGDISDAVEAMKLGAVDYLVKPFDPDELLIRLKKAVNDYKLRANASAGAASRKSGGWIGSAASMKALYSLIEKVAPTTSTILITGESGTGKEVAARQIHTLSNRMDGPFIPINIGGIPENLLESELFGYEKGAFTGADTRKPGLFELANGGTLFLDEIGDMPQQMQVKILRVLQDKRIMRLGAARQLPIDVRIIAATNRNLESDVRNGRFREDLFYRLAVIRMEIPPLRERLEDIPALVSYFVEKFSSEMARKKPLIHDDVYSFLSSYSFPGNVRELENAVERAMILCDGSEIRSKDFSFAGANIKGTENPEKMDLSLQELEKHTILKVLRMNDGHREKSASVLGISRRTLLNKMKEYGIHEDL